MNIGLFNNLEHLFITTYIFFYLMKEYSHFFISSYMRDKVDKTGSIPGICTRPESSCAWNSKSWSKREGSLLMKGIAQWFQSIPFHLIYENERALTDGNWKRKSKSFIRNKKIDGSLSLGCGWSPYSSTDWIPPQWTKGLYNLLEPFASTSTSLRLV